MSDSYNQSSIKFLPYGFMHIEDDLNFANSFNFKFVSNDSIKNSYGGYLHTIKPRITSEHATDIQVRDEFKRIEDELHGNIDKGNPSYLHFVTAAVAREFLSKYLPAAIVSDTSFPLNGKKVAEWIKTHGFPNYPLIGLSATPLKLVDPELRDWFAESNARYFTKGSCKEEDVIGQVTFNTDINRRKYGSSDRPKMIEIPDELIIMPR